MNHFITYGILAALPLSALADPDKGALGIDQLRFNEKANNDTIHGKFVSFGNPDTIMFKSSEAIEPTTFSTLKLHRLTLNHGRADQALLPTSSVTLINGDVLPGKIIHADSKRVTLETEHLGQLTISTDSVSKISPTPHGGKLVYYGPINSDGWKTISPPEKKDQEEKKATEEEQDKEDAKEKKDLTDWKLVAGAWYAGSDKQRYLVRENALPDTCKVKFKIAWRGSLYCNIGIHSDLAPPEYTGEDKITSNMASTLGKSYVISLSSHSASLYTCTFDEEGKPLATRSENTHISTNLSNEEEASIELRIDRSNKTLMLYINDRFKTKWDLGENYIAHGSAIAFKNLRYNNSQLRVSDLLITHWNGMRDSAQSMQTNDRDIILLTNGVDRFSGTFNHMKDGKVSFRGTFDNDLTIPTGSVQEIRLASNNLRKIPEDKEDKSVHFHFQPFGKISGIPASGTNGRTKIHSDIVGDISLDMKFVSIIDFSLQNNLLDFWDDNF